MLRLRSTSIVILLVLATIGAGLVGYFSSNKKQNIPTLFHYSYFQTPDISDKGFAEAGRVTAENNVIGIMVSHHLLAAHLIAQAFLSARNMNPDTVIVVSPNHFNQGYAKVITSREAWQTPYGMLSPDTKLVDALIKEDSRVSAEEFPFIKEHGISSIMPFVKKMFPNAKVIPLITRDALSVEDGKTIGQELSALAPQNSLLVASFDFSHETTNDLAMKWDKVSLAAITSFDYQTLETIHIDSRSGLALSLGYIEARNGTFNLLENTNAAQLLKNPLMTDVTSYIIGYFTTASPK